MDPFALIEDYLSDNENGMKTLITWFLNQVISLCETTSLSSRIFSFRINNQLPPSGPLPINISTTGTCGNTFRCADPN